MKSIIINCLNFLSIRILAFTEKIQEQLYKLANDLINKAINNRIIDTRLENQQINKKIIGISETHLETKS